MRRVLPAASPPGRGDCAPAQAQAGGTMGQTSRTVRLAKRKATKRGSCQDISHFFAKVPKVQKRRGEETTTRTRNINLATDSAKAAAFGSKTFEAESRVTIDVVDGHVFYDPHFIDLGEADCCFKTLREETKWQHDTIKVFGKVYPQPRLTALFANNSKPYRYSNITMHPSEFSPLMKEIQAKVEAEVGLKFTTCLLNLYRDGQDSNAWHADNEKELGQNPVIASVSFGAVRAFHMKHREDKSQKLKLSLENGSLLVMSGRMQHHWLHQIPKTKKQVGERINLTFRIIK